MIPKIGVHADSAEPVDRPPRSSWAVLGVSEGQKGGRRGFKEGQRPYPSSSSRAEGVEGGVNQRIQALWAKIGPRAEGVLDGRTVNVTSSQQTEREVCKNEHGVVRELLREWRRR